MINLDAPSSTPYWQPQVVPPEGAPNILLVIIDDEGFGAPSTFGGVIPTPNLDKIASTGLRYTQFHTTSLCSPTRAALITGRNHHSVGFGVIGEAATGYPGYNSVITKDKATIGTILKANGYATSWFGKNHNTPAFQTSQVGPFDQWPIGMGFEYFYGFNCGETNQWQPDLYRNTTRIYPYLNNPGYNLITDMADDAINHIEQINALDPNKPFFVYYAPGATHAPHHPTQEWIDKFKGKFSMGWNALRDQIFANQKKLGVIPQDAELTPWPHDLLKNWDELNADEKKLFERQMEVYAAYLAYVDDEVGRVVKTIEDMGKLDNTLIIYISGDNGPSAEGSPVGTPNEMTFFNGVEVPVADQMPFIDAVGLGRDLSALRGRLGLGDEHALQVDQAGRRLFRRHAERHGDLLAGPHQGRRRHPQPVPPRHRHRPDHPRGDRDQGAGGGRRHRPGADRGRQPRLHLRQGQCRRPVAASHAVFRDVRRARASTTTAGWHRRCPSARRGTARRPIPRTSSTTPSGNSTTSPRTGRRTTTSPRPTPASSPSSRICSGSRRRSTRSCRSTRRR